MRGWIPLLVLLAIGSAPAAAAAALTPFGLGPLKIGMREADAAKRLGLHIAADDGANSFDCRVDEIPRYPGLYAMAERGVITRITIGEPNRLRTDRGLGIGSMEADVRRAYGRTLKIATAAYDDEPAHDLTFWIAGKKRGILYEPDQQGRVTFIRAGGSSIQYVEGCL